jgi:hypothetical protein
MAKETSSLLNLVAWLTGVIVSLAVGFGMVGGTWLWRSFVAGYWHGG